MKIKEIIEKLKNTDIESLKNIDIEQVKEILKTRPDILINVILAILIIILPILIHNKNKMTINTLKRDSRELSQKLDIIKEGDRVQKKYDKFLENFPRTLPSDNLTKQLTEYAIKHNIQINSFSAAKNSTVNNFTDLTTISMDITAKDYLTMVYFIKELETSPFALRVDSLSFKGAGERSTGTKQNFQVNIQLGALQIKE